MFMPNIPRRKIYENLLKYEDSILEIRILILNEMNFEKYKDKYADVIDKLIISYEKINALLIIFLENKKYETEEAFDADINYYIKEKKEMYQILLKNKNFTNEFKKNIEYLNKEFNEYTNISYDFLKDISERLDLYNSNIPEILTLRRDQMK